MGLITSIKHARFRLVYVCTLILAMVITFEVSTIFSACHGMLIPLHVFFLDNDHILNEEQILEILIEGITTS